MGRRRSGQHRSVADDFDNDDADDLSSHSRTKTMDEYLNKLFEKRGSTRENALSSITEGFTINIQHQFAENNFATLLYRCLYSFKKGSSKEICLASHALGLLAITIGSGNNAHELYNEAIHPLSQALKSGSEALLSSIFDSLALITFVGGSNSEETERSMQIIWHFIHSESSVNVIARKHSATVLTAAISAWLFLLTTMNGWNLNHSHWKGAISFFLDILEVNDESTHAAARESLAIIFEVGCLEKFVCDTQADDNSINNGNNLLNGYSSIQELKEIIISRVSSLSRQAKGGTLANKATNEDFLKVLEDGFPETSVKIGKQILKICTLSQLLQLNFLKKFLGGGFAKHMLENELLHDAFDFTPKEQLPDNEPYICEREEATVHFFVPEVRKKDNEGCRQRITKSPNSVLQKARTQLLNKQRAIKGDELWPLDD